LRRSARRGRVVASHAGRGGTAIVRAFRRLAARALGLGIVAFARLLTAVRGIYVGMFPDTAPRVYFANHASNGDFVLLWAVLPPWVRARTRPVAAADYWMRSALRAFVGREVFDAVLIERDPAARTEDPVAQMAAALDAGASLIIFPEGRRNETDEALLPFKTGIYHLSAARPGTELVPVWIANLNRVLPRGHVVPVPLICTVTFGAPIRLQAGEGRDAFLARARAALLDLAPGAPEDAA